MLNLAGFHLQWKFVCDLATDYEGVRPDSHPIHNFKGSISAQFIEGVDGGSRKTFIRLLSSVDDENLGKIQKEDQP